tara:strand:+ start:993 stop:1298 length:306 start_codon:yes stop_codon:yes gene_type:complete
MGQHVNNNYKRGMSTTDADPAKYGKHWANINFELMTGAKATVPVAPSNQPIIGTLVIGNKRVELTFSEANKIMSEIVQGQQAYNTAKKLGQLEAGMGTYRG